MKTPAIRVRFAPSPTGYMHIGNLRTALFNWLFACHEQGVFLLRIEDTDLERSKPEYTQAIIDTLAWVGIKPHGQPVIQSENKTRHLEIAQQLIDSGHAYRCYCTGPELEARLGLGAAHTDSYTRYDALCRNRLQADSNSPFVVRFKIPDSLEHITFDDLIHGPITVSREQLDDFIIVRSDGSPVFNFVVVVDDADMGITHIIRGEDHISNTSKQILIYGAAGFALPAFAHLPMILGPHGNRLSKRDAAVGVLDYKQAGFLPQALCNYLVRLGWAHGDQEIFSQDELIKLFSLNDVGKKASIFDIKKLEWMNGIYIRQTSPEDLLEYILTNLDPEFKNKCINYDATCDHKKIIKLIKLYQERSKTLVELINAIYALLAGPSQEQLKTLVTLNAKKEYMTMLVSRLEQAQTIDPVLLESIIKDLCQQQSLSLADIAKPVRIALTGTLSSPGIYELITILGKEETIKRLQAAIAVLEIK